MPHQAASQARQKQGHACAGTPAASPWLVGGATVTLEALTSATWAVGSSPMRRISTRVVEKQQAAAAAAATAGSGESPPAAWPAGDAGNLNSASFLTSMNVRAPPCPVSAAHRVPRLPAGRLLCSPKGADGCVLSAAHTLVCPTGVALSVQDVEPGERPGDGPHSDLGARRPDVHCAQAGRYGACAHCPVPWAGTGTHTRRGRGKHAQATRRSRERGLLALGSLAPGWQCALARRAGRPGHQQAVVAPLVCALPCPRTALLPSHNSTPHLPPPATPPRSARSCQKCSSTATLRRL